MKISCQSCAAKYTIADEKVVGKIVKIRCKKCGATIVINGNEAGAVPQADDSSQDTRVFDYTSQQSGPGELWTVNVADGDQRTMSVQEVAAEYKAGTLNDETYCWKDGMSDWLPLRDIETLAQACDLGPNPSLLPANEEPPLFGGGGRAAAAAAAQVHAAGTNGNGAAPLFGGNTPAPAAARRAGGRGAGGADLFGAVEQAGGESDAAKMPPPALAEDPSKPTGQRNENSVLFSLAALTEKKAEPAVSTTAQGEGSGLIDIRALSNAMGPKAPEAGARVDDIMNLAGGGAFSPALAAPVLAPPPLEGTDLSNIGPSPRGNRALILAILGAGALLAIAIVAVVIMTRKPDPVATPLPAPIPAPTAPPAAVAQNDTPAANPTAATPASPAAPPTTAAPPSTGHAEKSERPAPAAHGGGGGGGGAKAAPRNEPASPPPAAPAGNPKSLEAAMAQSAGGGSKPAAAEAAGSSPFDRGAAAAALGAAAASLGSCKKPDGPTGAGHVKVTFQPSGSVSVVEVDAAPYSGTSVGGCVAGKFKSAHVPAFSGSPVTVGKSFAIN